MAMHSRSCVRALMLAVSGLWLFIGSTNAVPALHMDSIDDYNTFGAMITPAAYSMGARRLLTSHDPVLQSSASSTGRSLSQLLFPTVTVTINADKQAPAKIAAAPLATSSSSRGIQEIGNSSSSSNSISSTSSSSVNPDDLPASAFDQTVDDQDCISDPEEFIRVWRSPNLSDRDRCVDESIIVRLSNGRAACSSLQEVLTGFFKRLSPVSFWAFKDAPEKYLRIGIPQTVGSYVDGANMKTMQNKPSYANWANGLFPGIREQSNGVSMLTQIGFGSAFYRIDLFYMMFVGKRDKAKMSTAGVPTFVPTWDNVRIYYQDYIRQYIKKQNGELGNPLDFSIPKEVTDGDAGFPGLANIDLSDLTGCPSQCTYEDTRYPLPAGGVPTRVPAFTPGAYANHTKQGDGSNKCGVPVVMVPKNASACITPMEDVGAKLLKNKRLMLAEPTQLAVDELTCTDPDWRRYYLVGDFPSTPTWSLVNGTVTWTGGKFPGLFEVCNKERQYPGPLFMTAFLEEWNKIAPTDYKKKAVLFRAFLMAGCAGNFNQLFSGNGLIYTGHGGVSSATVHELLLGAINGSNADTRITGPEKLLGNYAYAFFCIDGTEGCCPHGNCKELGKPAWNR